VQLGLGLSGLFVSGPAAAASVLIASLGVTAAGKAWDGSPAGEEGTVARAARAVAAVSVSVPVVVIIDDADRLDPGLARTQVRNLAGRVDGQVLVVPAADPQSGLVAALTSQAGMSWPTEFTWPTLIRVWATAHVRPWRASCSPACPLWPSSGSAAEREHSGTCSGYRPQTG
jgi:hypothetical protein